MIVLTASLIVPLAPSVNAHHRPNKWCAQGGEWCLNAYRREGHGRVFWLYHDGEHPLRFRICVRAPSGHRDCRKYRAAAEMGTTTLWVRWRDHFPHRGAGAYTVVWRAGGQRIGKKLGFHQR
jgi:hypothetical protein